MKFFNINFATVMVRFFLMMAVVIGGLFAGQGWLAVLALPIFLSVMLGISFERTTTPAKAGVIAYSETLQNKQAA